jgi:hypothetical protein
MDNQTVIAILAIVFIAVWLWPRLRGDRSRQAEKQLRRICLSDDRKVERLIDAEMTRSPGISRGEAASRAVDRYQRDNR